MTHSSAPLAAVPGLAGVASSRVTRHRPLQRYGIRVDLRLCAGAAKCRQPVAAGDIRDIGVDN